MLARDFGTLILGKIPFVTRKDAATIILLPPLAIPIPRCVKVETVISAHLTHVAVVVVVVVVLVLVAVVALVIVALVLVALVLAVVVVVI